MGATATPAEEPPVTRWHGRTLEEWRARWGVPELRIYRSVASTNDTARRLAEAGAPEGTTVVADEQTRGRGRRGRVWRSDPGQSLILSMVLRPATMGAESVVSIRLGLATARAIESVAPVAVAVKWPNDLLVDGRKVGGMLCEGAIEGGTPVFVIAGTGVNVAQDDDAWTGPLAGRATSLAARSGSDVAIPDLAGAVVAAWLDVLERPAATLSAEEVDAYRRRDALAGRSVAVDGELAGRVVGVAPDGALRLERDGNEVRVVSGTIRSADNEPGEQP